MFTENILSSKPVPAAYVKAGGSPEITRLVCITDGPTFYQDSSLGLDVRVWESRSKDLQFILSAEGITSTIILNNPCSLITDFNFCFNQNADLYLCYTEQDSVYWQWYNTATAKYTTTKLPQGTRSARCTLDDKRNSQTGRSDIILAYIREDGALCFRKQRDRFTVEYLLDVGPFISLEKMYMNKGWRLQFECVVGMYTLPPRDVLKSYTRLLVHPRVTPNYVGFKLGDFDTGYIYPTNQTLDLKVSEVTGVYWEDVPGGTLMNVEFSEAPTADSLPYFYMYVDSLKLRMYRISPTLYSANLDEIQAATLNNIPTTAIQLLFEYPGTINATQEF